jgi:hypothetical protein
MLHSPPPSPGRPRPHLSAIRTALPPVYIRLREYHCLTGDTPLTATTELNLRGVSVPSRYRGQQQQQGGSDKGADEGSGLDGVLGGWMPPRWNVREDGEGATFWDPVTRQETRYALHTPGTRPYAPNVMRKLDELRASSCCGAEPRTPASAVDEGDRIDDDDVYEDTVEHESSGVQDIVLLGETGAPHAAAWGDHVFVGRVRSWDGLVVLLRLPRVATRAGESPHAAAFHADPHARGHDHGQAHSGRWVFRGYVHGGNWVGRWRETATAVDVVGLEGGFCVSKVEGEGW